MRRLRFIWFFLLVGLFVLGSVQLVDVVVSNSVKDRVMDLPDALMETPVAMVLGTSKYLVQGGTNPFYTNRIKSVGELYHKNRIQYILVSGDNGQVEYDEPQTIRKDLISEGVDPDHIYLDFAGFRTFDSMVRAKEVFGLQKFIVVSQRFHLERALFIGKWLGLEVQGYVALGPGFQSGFKVLMREKFARVKMLMDLLWGTQPKYLGEPVAIPSLSSSPLPNEEVNPQ
jgi:SanA protein